MSLKLEAEQWLRSVAINHVGANICRYTWTSYFGEIRHNALGGVTYLSPCEGKVVDASNKFTLVKTGANAFCVVLADLLSQPVNVGDKIALSFYKLKRFDGSAADGSEDAAVGGCRTISLTGAETLFPVRWESRHLGINEKFAEQYREIDNPYLRDMLVQMEKLPVNDGYRRVVNVLVDANAKNLDFVDPPEEESAAVPPAISMDVATGKFVGRIVISYNRAVDYYEIRLAPTTASQLATPLVSGSQAELKMPLGEAAFTDLCFDQLGEALQDAIDDEAWKQARVTMIKAAPQKRATQALTA